jgi:uncharacterized membrane protein (UPF0127 family)
MARHTFHVVNATRGSVLATQVRLATKPWTRLAGLLGCAALRAGEGVHIVPCQSVHTLFMRFSIDVLYLDGDARVVKAVAALRPFRFSSGGRRARSTLELPTGTIVTTATQVGDQVRFDDVCDIGNRA